MPVAMISASWSVLQLSFITSKVLPWNSSRVGSASAPGKKEERDGPIPRMITLFWSVPVIMNPPINTFSPVCTRMRVQTGENVLIGGFIITGTDQKRVIIRGIGPSLSSFFPGALADPTLELFQGNTLLVMNDNWRTDQEAEIIATGIPPTDNLESAIVRTLTPGSYTAVLRGNGNTTGIGVVEAYDLDRTANSRLANIATRGFVETGDNVMIGGLIIGPAGGGSARV